MPVRIAVHEDERFVEATFEGPIAPTELMEAVLECLAAARRIGTPNFFADCTALLPGQSAFDIYHLVQGYEALGVERTMREAVLVPAGTATEQDLAFYETVASNRGYCVRVFVDRDQALGWLLEADRRATP